MRFFASKQKGESLIETLIYASILTIMAIAVTQSLLMMMKSYGNIKLHRSMNISVSDAMERITREIRLADSVDIAGSALGTSPGKIKVNTVDDLGSATTKEFFLSGTGVYAKEGASTPEALTSSSTEITSLIFRRITAGEVSESVKINLTARVKVGNLEKTENFYNTAIMRGSY